RLRQEAEAAIERAAIEQEAALRLREEAEAAATRAAAAARAASEAQQRLGRISDAALPEQVALRSASALDGPWTSDWSCEASAEGPATSLRLPAQVQQREIRIEVGQVGLPGYFRAYGTIADDGAF